jgi:hypothetical protein
VDEQRVPVQEHHADHLPLPARVVEADTQFPSGSVVFECDTLDA